MIYNLAIKYEMTNNMLGALLHPMGNGKSCVCSAVSFILKSITPRTSHAYIFYVCYVPLSLRLFDQILELINIVPTSPHFLLMEKLMRGKRYGSRGKGLRTENLAPTLLRTENLAPTLSHSIFQTHSATCLTALKKTSSVNQWKAKED